MSTAPMEDHKESNEHSTPLNQAPKLRGRTGQARTDLAEAWDDMRPFAPSSHHSLHSPFSSVSIFCTCQGFHSTKKFKNHHIWITSKRTGCNTSPWTAACFHWNYSATVLKPVWDKNTEQTLPGHAMPPKGTFASLMLLQFRLLDIAGNGLSSGKTDYLGCLICNTLYCTGNLSYLHLSELLFSLSILYKCLYIRAPPIAPTSQGLLGGCTQTVGVCSHGSRYRTAALIQVCPWVCAWFCLHSPLPRGNNSGIRGTQSRLLSPQAWAPMQDSPSLPCHPLPSLCLYHQPSKYFYFNPVTFLSCSASLAPQLLWFPGPSPLLLCFHTHRLPLDTQPVLPQQDPQVLRERSHPWLTQPKANWLRILPPQA